ncbi:MAG: UDP-N-acetylmuramate dehydrogenase [Pirellulaceae bacterium]
MPFPKGFEHIVREQEPLAPYTWLRIGGLARFFCEPNTTEELQAVVRQATAENLPIRLLGGGSNLLVRENGVDGVVLWLSAPAFCHLHVNDLQVTAGGGVKLAHLISRCAAEGLEGMEHLVGIPGTLGGALHGNSGTLNGSIGDHLVSVRVMNSQGEVSSRPAQSLEFAHRKSSLDDLVILDATFHLHRGDAKAIMQRLQTLWIIKKSHQPPLATPSIIPFVDPAAESVADLIRRSKIASPVEGKVRLSDSHPGYLTSAPGATSDQVLALVHRVREAVAKSTGVQLRLHMEVW